MCVCVRMFMNACVPFSLLTQRVNAVAAVDVAYGRRIATTYTLTHAIRYRIHFQ